MILGLFPNLAVIGGIARGGRHAAAALAGYAARKNIRCQFLCLNDPPGIHELCVGETTFSFQGFGRAKTRFLLAALRAAARGPRLVFVAHANLAPVAALTKILAPRVRTVVQVHGIEVWNRLPAYRRRALLRADLVLASSSDTAARVVEVQGVPRRCVRRVAWGLDPEFPSAAAPAGPDALPAGFPVGQVVLTVGRQAANERYKGTDLLIEALPQLVASAPAVQLVVVGEGDDVPRLQQIASERSVAERVHFLGSLAGPALVACYRHCHLFAMPSRGEGFGLVFLEAMAFGRPVIGGAHGGTPDVVEDGVTGLLVQHGDVARLVAALKLLLTDESARQEMGDRARARVQSEFLFEHYKERFTRLLEDERVL